MAEVSSNEFMRQEAESRATLARLLSKETKKKSKSKKKKRSVRNVNK